VLSAAMMLRYAFDMMDEADCIAAAMDEGLADGVRTADIVGNSDIAPIGCKQMTEEIIKRL